MSIDRQIMSEPAALTLPNIALSVRQPWAWAFFHADPVKDIENREGHSPALKCQARLGDRIAIHASGTMTRAEYENARSFMIEKCGVTCPPPDELVRGAIVGSVRITAIVKKSDSPWWMGPHGIVLEDPEPCEPIAVGGQLGYFNWQAASHRVALCETKPWMKTWPARPGAKRKEPEDLPGLPLLEGAP